jgi:hypothetical protein
MLRKCLPLVVVFGLSVHDVGAQTTNSDVVASAMRYSPPAQALVDKLAGKSCSYNLNYPDTDVFWMEGDVLKVHHFGGLDGKDDHGIKSANVEDSARGGWDKANGSQLAYTSGYMYFLKEDPATHAILVHNGPYNRPYNCTPTGK